MLIKLSDKQKITAVPTFQVAPIMQQILKRENHIDRAKEHFWIIGLNNICQILFIELAALGSANMLNIKPREGFRLAIHKLAIQVILVHSHPSGSVRPSQADKDFTAYFYEAGRFLKVEVLDHLIISEDKFFSFSDEGLMKEIREDKRFFIPHILEEEARALGIKQGFDLGIKAGEQQEREKQKERLKEIKALERQKQKEAVQAAKAAERQKKAEALEKERQRKAEAIQAAKETERRKKEEALEKERQKMAENSLKAGLSVEMVAELTGLSQLEIKQLQASLELS